MNILALVLSPCIFHSEVGFRFLNLISNKIQDLNHRNLDDSHQHCLCYFYTMTSDDPTFVYVPFVSKGSKENLIKIKNYLSRNS